MFIVHIVYNTKSLESELIEETLNIRPPRHGSFEVKWWLLFVYFTTENEKKKKKV